MFQTPFTTLQNVRERVLSFIQEKCTEFVQPPEFDERRFFAATVSSFMLSAIVDGTEQRCFNSRNNTTNAAFYSAKKKQHSVNILIVCSPQMKVYFVSQSYPGRNVDSTIANQEIEMWTENWQEHELIVADQGFVQGPRLIIPDDYLPHLAKDLRTVRCRVENCIAMFKQFAVCREVLREKINQPSGWNTILFFHQRMWQIVAGLVNCNLEGNFK